MLRAKKSLGQHFLNDEYTAKRIVESFLEKKNCDTVLEVGSGKGVLTKYLFQRENIDLYSIELDQRMIPVLIQKLPRLTGKIFNEDILDFDFRRIGPGCIGIIGNFPYNISSQILFRVLENRDQVHMVVGMFQKEVARRITSPPGTREYGILSVLIQAFYEVEYMFDVEPACFTPAPKVMSGVIRLIKKEIQPVIKNEQRFFKIVKDGFGKRRKMLRNSLDEWIGNSERSGEEIFNKRAEHLTVAEWIELSNTIS